MPTPTYVALGTITLTGTASEVIFSSIPATYRDLVLITSNTSTAPSQASMKFNSDSGSNYSRVTMFGNGSTAGSNAVTGQTNINIHAEATITSANGAVTVTQIMDYSATDKHKTGLSRLTAPAEITLAQAFRWADTSAIHTISLSAPFSIGSTFSLYGVN